MTKRRQSLGRAGEQEASDYLAAGGYRIVARNVRAARVEIDIIARRGPLLVFVEVKSRRQTGRGGFGHHGAAAEAVDSHKQQRLRRGAQAWLDAHPMDRRRAQRVRFDVVTCVLLKSAADKIRPDDLLPRAAAEPGPQNDDTAPLKGTRWSVEHWQAAF